MKENSKRKNSKEEIILCPILKRIKKGVFEEFQTDPNQNTNSKFELMIPEKKLLLKAMNNRDVPNYCYLKKLNIKRRR